jgi:hypothetical protein
VPKERDGEVTEMSVVVEGERGRKATLPVDLSMFNVHLYVEREKIELEGARDAGDLV